MPFVNIENSYSLPVKGRSYITPFDRMQRNTVIGDDMSAKVVSGESNSVDTVVPADTFLTVILVTQKSNA